MLRKILGLLLFTSVCALALPITVDQLVVFGDSLSDDGNASIASLGTYPGPNYATMTVAGVPFPVGYYTDGPNTTPGTSSPTGLWINQFATLAGLTNPGPALAPLGGTDFAVASALTGTANPQDMGNQVALYLSDVSGAADPNSLYVFWGGANDILDGGSGSTAAANIDAEIGSLASAGAKDFLWLNLPSLGDTPELSGDAALAGAANAQSAAFNMAWSADVASLNALGLDVIGVNVNSLFNSILGNPGAYGFTNVTDPAQGNASANPNQYLFWDDVHPTTEADALVANLALDAVNAPEPGSFVLLLSGAIGLGIYRRRKS